MSSEWKADQFTRLAALIGHPIDQSPSPIMHNEAFRVSCINAVYLAFDVPPAFLKSVVSGMRAMNALGFNVTIPHKVAALDLLDESDQLVKDVGAVNTVVNQNGTLKGYNTDVVGIIAAFDRNGVSVDGSSALVIGAGGAARACLTALSAKGCKKFHIANRTLHKAKSLAKEFSRKYGIECSAVNQGPKAISEASRSSDIVLNATPVGAYPSVEECVLPRECLRPDLIVFDVVYKPIRTKLIDEASKAGAKVVTGLEMLVEQGAATFKLWTGRDPPRQIMRKAVESVLS